MANENIVTNIVANADFSGLITDLNRVTGSLAKMQEQVAASNKMLANQIAVMNRSFSDTLRSTGQFSTHFVTLNSDVDKFGKGLDSGRLKLKEYYRVWQDQAKTSGGLIRDLSRQQVQLQNAILQPLGRNAQGLMQFNVQIPRGLDEIKNKTALAKQELQIMNKVVQDGAVQLINWGKNTQWAGRQLTVGLTVPLAAFGKAAADAFRMADQELTRLTKVYGDIAGTSAAELGKVRDDVSKTAKELASAYGASFKDTIALAADIAATGKTGNELLGAVSETTRLAILGEVDRQDAMKATLSIQTAFKQNTEELAQSINFLNAVENQTSTTLTDLVEAIPKAGPVIKGLGGSVQDLALYLTAMREGGVSASEGANALKSALASLINPTDVAVNKFSTLGIDLLGIVNRNAGDVTKTLFELQAALDNLNPLQKQQAIEQLFGKFQFSRLNALFENLGRQGSQTLQVLDLMNASASQLEAVAGRELTAVTESASGKYRRALEGLKADLATVGEQFLKINTTLINFVSNVIEFINKLPDPIKSALTFLGGLTATAGPLIMLTGVLANFFGYIVKGVYHFKSLFKGGEGWKMLTPEILAAERAGSLVEKTFYSDAKAAAILQQAIHNLSTEFELFQQKAATGTISVQPALSTMAGNLITPGGVGPRVVDPNSPYVGGIGTRASSHINPRDPNNPATMFGLVPGAMPVNLKIGRTPQIYMKERLPEQEGLTTVGGVSTGIVAGEAARFHSLMATLGMQTEAEVNALKQTIATGGAVSADLINTFDDILPLISQITDKAAAQSAKIVAELKAGKMTVEAAKAEIIALNSQIEAQIGATAVQFAAERGRTIDVTKVPMLDQPVVGTTGKSNMRELFKKSGVRRVMEALGRVTRTKTYGAPYSIETTRPQKFANGVTSAGIRKFAGGVTAVRAAASMLRAFSQKSGMIGGLRKVDARSTRVGAERDAGISFGELYRRSSGIYSNPEYTAYGISPTSGSDVLIHGMVPAFRARTRGLERSGSGPVASRSQYEQLGLQMDPRTMAHNERLQLLPTQFVKNSGAFNTALSKGSANPAAWRPVSADDMVSLLLFLKSQGVPPNKARIIADRAAQVLNSKIASHRGPITEAMFGNLLNNASVRAIKSGFFPSMVPANAPGQGSFWGRPGLVPNKFADGVTQLPGYGGGDIIPALLEPGESVVTKEATQKYGPIISAMNQNKFQEGVVNAGRGGMMKGLLAQTALGYAGMYGGQALGGALGGQTGSMIGGTIGSLVSLAPMFTKLGTEADKATGKANGFKNVLSALVGLPGPVKAIAAIAAVGMAVKSVNDKINEHRRIVTLGFGQTEESADKLGIKFDTLSTQLKDFKERTDLAAASTKDYYAAITSSGVPGLNLTIQQLKELKDKVKTDLPDFVEIFNKARTDEVIVKAQQLKAQFISGGMSAEEATQKIYAIIGVSNKASQALAGIANEGFAAIKDKASAASKSIEVFNKLLVEGNADQLVASFDSVINSIQAAEKALIGTKNEQDGIVDSAEAFKMQLEAINSTQLKNVKLGESGVQALAKQDPILASILNKNDDIAGAYAKIRMYLKGIDTDLAGMNSKMAQQVALVTELQAQQLTATGGKYKKISDQIAAYTKIAESSSKATIRREQDTQKKLEEQIKSRQKLIDKIREEADARVEALERTNAAEDFRVQIQKKQLDYQDKISAGDMSGAAQIQLDIQSMVGQREKDLAVQSIRDREAVDIKAQEAIIEALQKKIETSQAAVETAGRKAEDALKKASDLQSLLNELITATINANNGLSDLEEKQLAVLQDKLTKSGFGDIAKGLGYQGSGSVKLPNGFTIEMGKGKSGIEQTATDVLRQVLTQDGKLSVTDEKVYNYLTKTKFGQTGPTSTVTGTQFGGGPIKATAAANVFEAAKQASSGKVQARMFADPTGAVYDLFTYKNKTYAVDKVTGSVIYEFDTTNNKLGARVKKAAGGYMSGPGTGTSDSIPAMLSNGEYVVRAAAVQQYGVPFFDAINKAGGGYIMPKYATGGMALSYGRTAKRYASGGLAYRMAYGNGGEAMGLGSEVIYNTTFNISNGNMDEAITKWENHVRMREAMNGRNVLI